MIYEFTTLAYRPIDAERVKDGIFEWTTEPGADGELLGCWETENGALFRLNVLRSFVTRERLDVERRRALLAVDPWHSANVLTGLDQITCQALPFVPPVRPGNYGPVYEIRNYLLRPGGLSATIAGWEAALPGRTALSPLSVVMYTLDGPIRLIHIWPYPGHDARVAIRRESYAKGLWPPAGGPENILEGTSTIAIPVPFSPLT